MFYKIITFALFLVCFSWLVIEPSFGAVVACLTLMAATFRGKIHGIIGKQLLSLTPRNTPLRSLTHSRYSFSHPEYINPMILADLQGWLSDLGNQNLSVNIADANKSNRYYSNINIHEKSNYPVVTATQKDEMFSYQYIGRSFSGVHLVQTWRNTGGSGIFCNIMLLTLTEETTVDIDLDKTKKSNLFVVRKVSTIPLGDRYEGNISYRFGLLTIGPCKDMRTLRNDKQRLFIL